MANMVLARLGDESFPAADGESFDESHAKHIANGLMPLVEQLIAEAVAAQEAALRDLMQNANRLCDRNLGGTYEDDCRRSIAAARALLTEAPDGV